MSGKCTNNLVFCICWEQEMELEKLKRTNIRANNDTKHNYATYIVSRQDLSLRPTILFSAFVGVIFILKFFNERFACTSKTKLQ
jgi:hypothetical protein